MSDRLLLGEPLCSVVATTDEESAESCDRCHDCSNKGRYEMPVYLPEVVYDSILVQSRCSYDCDHDDHDCKTKRKAQSDLLSPSDLDLPDEPDWNDENWTPVLVESFYDHNFRTDSSSRQQYPR